MKKTIVILTILMFCFSFSALALADTSTPKEVVQKVTEAAKLLKEKGKDAFPALKDKNGPFIWKGNYVFVLNFDGVVQAHPIVPKLEGRSLIKMKDPNGRLFIADMVRLAMSPSKQGWLEYRWPKPGSKKASQKSGFVMGVPEHRLLVCSGVWDMGPEEATAKAK